MYILFDEGGKFLMARVLSQSDASSQVELESGKRVKVKTANILASFDKPNPEELLRSVQNKEKEIELDLAWEFAPENEFSFIDLARDYFSNDADLVAQVAMLFALFNAPHYFRRSGKGRFKKASKEIVDLALAAIEKKKLIEDQVNVWADHLINQQCPEPIQTQLFKILFKPDKNAPEYRAVVKASKNTEIAPLKLLQNAGAIKSPYDFHHQRFMSEFLPKGEIFPTLPKVSFNNELPLASVGAFSIDDESTTEIDDAFSVSGIGSGEVVLGIHIAAPSLGISPRDAIDNVARSRMSTIYMPGHKITMLPSDVVENFTLKEGCDCPAVSLYLVIDEATLEIKSHSTRIEKVQMAHNLRLEALTTVVTPEWLTGYDLQLNSDSPAPIYLQNLRSKLSFLYQLALSQQAKRDEMRGKPETFTRPSFSFKVHDAPQTGPTGIEKVSIEIRPRGSALDLLVAENMILANRTWGRWLADLNVPGIYRSQASIGFGSKVRMSSKALPHAGMGVDCYAWSTSPLRRYTDMVNQWQISTCVQYGVTAALKAPFKPNDSDLFGIIAGFEELHEAYRHFQNSIERYWTLKYIEQENITEVIASVLKDNLVRCLDLPLVFSVMGADKFSRGTLVRIKLSESDLIALDIKGVVMAQLDNSDNEQNPQIDLDDEQENLSATLTIAIDVTDSVDPTQEAVTSPQNS